ncbi:DUF4476 domain-containing protein [Lacibacter sp. H375]|uniref:DUF4476 domain-containing protein n=1 Tax=Lacibacter sp. H375 TaxID=3133424 RepID=UPI0030C588D0
MKKIFTLFTFLLMVVATFAAWDEARLSITNIGNEPIRVLIDGRQVQQGNNKEIRINNLNAGNHRIQIYSVNNNNNNRRRGGLFGNSNRENLIYSSNINVRRGMHTDIVINRFGKVFVDEERIDQNYDNGWNNNDRNNGGWDNGYGNDDRWGNDNRNDNGYGNGNVMSYERFQQLKQSVERENFDKNKMDLLRSTLPYNRVSSQQVRELAQLIQFEQTKLELAKFAYRYTTDRGNYFVVNDVFNFGSSKTELTRYISSYRD